MRGIHLGDDAPGRCQRRAGENNARRVRSLWSSLGKSSWTESEFKDFRSAVAVEFAQFLHSDGLARKFFAGGPSRKIASVQTSAIRSSQGGEGLE